MFDISLLTLESELKERSRLLEREQAAIDDLDAEFDEALTAYTSARQVAADRVTRMSGEVSELQQVIGILRNSTSSD